MNRHRLFAAGPCKSNSRLFDYTHLIRLDVKTEIRCKLLCKVICSEDIRPTAFRGWTPIEEVLLSTPMSTCARSSWDLGRTNLILSTRCFHLEKRIIRSQAWPSNHDVAVPRWRAQVHELWCIFWGCWQKWLLAACHGQPMGWNWKL